ncbi:MAG: hypothetical protein ACUVTF_03660, partial [bacterium]
KIKLKDDIKQLEQRLGNEKVLLESFILSKTPYEKLIEGRLFPPSKDDYINHNVLFLEDKDWAEKLFKLLSNATDQP